MIEILGYIFATILTAAAVWFVYHIIRGAVLGFDMTRWMLIGVNWQQIRSNKNWMRKLVLMFLNCWYECFGYNGGITYSRNGRTWSGFGTGRAQGQETQD